MHHEFCKRYNKKFCLVTEQCHGGDGRHSRRDSEYHHHNYKWQDHGDSGCCDNYDKCDKKWENKTPSDCGNKAFKPCLVHGPKSKNTSEECTRTPRLTNVNFKTKNAITKCITTTRATQVMMTSRALAPIHRSQVRTWHQPRARSKKTHKDANYHLHVAKTMKAGSHVPRKSEHRQQRTKSQLSQKGKKGEMPHTFLDNDLNFMDTILMGLNSIDADLKRPDDIRNPYDFNL
jgi:hypothetical protein